MESFAAYQQNAAATARGGTALYKDQGRVAVACMGLAGEAGEVIDYLKKWVGHGHEIDKEHVKKELGDVLWYVSEIATALGLNLQEIAMLNAEKLRKRYPDGFAVERSRNRGE
jgi:NTP pyrophosphatase (non-canonical NTP hydrolase)